MTHRGPKKRKPPIPEAADSVILSRSFAQRLPLLVTAIIILSLVVARPCFPSEDAERGSGLLIVAFWWIASIGWGVHCISSRSLKIWWHWSDTLIAAGIAILICSPCWAESYAPARNLALEWTGLLLCYFLVRQVFHPPVFHRAMVTTLVAISVAIACYGLYQAFWGFELIRQDYALNKREILGSMGIVPGTPQQSTLENRLNSHEPYGPFALANSLGGFLLLATCVVSGAIAVGSSGDPSDAGLQRHASTFTRTGTLWIILAPLVLCLVMTQSRTAYLGLLVVIACLIFGYFRKREVRWRRLIASGVAGSFLVGGVIWLASLTGKVDTKLMTESFKSLSYRFEYWRGAASVVSEKIWFGVGLGNFRGSYLAHKLAESSEEISDPHNIVLELWANGGFFSAFFVIIGIIIVTARSLRKTANPATQPSPLIIPAASLFIGSLIAWFLWEINPVVIAGTAVPGNFFLLIVALLVTFFWILAENKNRCPVWVYGLATLALFIHLQGAGGIGMPAISQSFLVVLALIQTQRDKDPQLSLETARGGVAVTVLLLVGTITISKLWLIPIVEARTSSIVGSSYTLNGDLGTAIRSFRSATQLDPHEPEPWVQLSRIYFDRWRQPMRQQAERQRDFRTCVDSLRTALRLAPRRSEYWTLLGEIWRARAEVEPEHWPRATEAFEHAVGVYPTNSLIRASFADTLWLAGETRRSGNEMEIALNLSRQTPHLDKKLPDQQVREFEKRLSELNAD